MVSKAAVSPDELYVGRGSADSVWVPSVWGNPFRVSEVGSAARAVELYGEWLIPQEVAASIAVSGWQTFVMPLHQKLSVSC